MLSYAAIVSKHRRSINYSVPIRCGRGERQRHKTPIMSKLAQLNG
jgi:hypothetical protein